MNPRSLKSVLVLLAQILGPFGQIWVFHKFGWVFHKFTENGEFYIVRILTIRHKNRDACSSSLYLRNASQVSWGSLLKTRSWCRGEELCDHVKSCDLPRSLRILNDHVKAVWLAMYRGGNKMKKINFLVNPKWILLSFQYIRMVKKEFLIIGSILTLHI